MGDPETIRLDLPASYGYLDAVSTLIAALLDSVEGLREPAVLIYNIQLAVYEACTNIVRHAYGGRTDGRVKVTLILNRQARRLTVELIDTGSSFDPSAVAAINLDQPHERGYGLFLIHSLLDQVTYDPQPGRNRLLLVKDLS